MELRTAKTIFLRAKEAEGVSTRTYQTYESELTRFFWYVAEQGIYDVADIDANLIRGFLNSLKGQGLRNITIHRFYAEIRTLLIFLHREDYIQDNPIKNVKPPKVEQKQMRTFTAQEISKLLNSFDKNDFFGMRNYCIFALFFSTGIRKMELVNLTTKDLNINTDLIRISRGKGGKERFIPIGKTMRRILIQYLKMREEYLEGDICHCLFPSRSKRKLTNSGINALFRKLKVELKLTGEKISSHTWRIHLRKIIYLMAEIFSHYRKSWDILT